MKKNPAFMIRNLRVKNSLYKPALFGTYRVDFKEIKVSKKDN